MPFPRPLPMADRVIETTVPVETESGPLNCVVWSPNGEPLQRQLVLLGHGGTGHKKSPYLVWFAMRLVTDYNFVAAAIDHLPQHGDRGGVSNIRNAVTGPAHQQPLMRPSTQLSMIGKQLYAPSSTGMKWTKRKLAIGVTQVAL